MKNMSLLYIFLRTSKNGQYKNAKYQYKEAETPIWNSLKDINLDHSHCSSLKYTNHEIQKNKTVQGRNATHYAMTS